MAEPIVVFVEKLPAYHMYSIYSVRNERWSTTCEDPISDAAFEALKRGATVKDRLVVKFLHNGGEFEASIGCIAKSAIKNSLEDEFE